MRYMAFIEQGAFRMAQLIEDFLRFARLGSQPIERAPVDMVACVEQAIEQLMVGKADRRVEWVVGPLPQAQGDQALLRQVWINLISNALKYTGKTAAPRIQIHGAQVGNELVYSVVDNGVGFDAAKAAELFTAFTRLHSAAEFDGIGIGLASVKRIMQRHNGRVWAEGDVGRGASFHFALPLV